VIRPTDKPNGAELALLDVGSDGRRHPPTSGPDRQFEGPRLPPTAQCTRNGGERVGLTQRHLYDACARARGVA
jgi:hypothetical protein